MLRMDRCDLSLMKSRFYPPLMCKGFLLCFHLMCVFTMAEWVLLCRHEQHCSFIRPIWLLIVLPKLSFDSFDYISQGGLIHFVIGIYMWRSIFVHAEVVGAA